MKQRGSGILMHVSSLPSEFGIGDLGPSAYKFVDFLVKAKQSYWQVLPLNPTSPISGNSPYASFSAFAGNMLFISPDLLHQEKLIETKELEKSLSLSNEEVNYTEIYVNKIMLLRQAFNKFKEQKSIFGKDYNKFLDTNFEWIVDYASFMAFKSHFDDKVWSEWPAEIRDRNQQALKKLQIELNEEINFHIFIQFLFFRQWKALKKYCNQHGVQIIGDISYYVNYDSAEVWTNPQYFKLDKYKKPAFIAGVPPDYFSSTGQLWGNPVYNWDRLRKDNYSLWFKRIEQNLILYDIVRIDHFRGFLAYWEVPANETTAINGKWKKVNAKDFFSKLSQQIPNLPILAEDLGVITQDVKDLMQKFNLPGMRILLFAFDKNLPTNPYAPHNHIQNCVVYTGTHDNNTARGWFEQEVSEDTKQRLFEYIGHKFSADTVHHEFIRLALMSVANVVIIPLQDILGLDAKYRMNRPATLEGNWKWRLSPQMLSKEVSNNLGRLTELFGRSKN